LINARARAGQGLTTIEDIKKRLKQEGYDERVVADGGRSLTTQLKGLIKAAGADPHRSLSPEGEPGLPNPVE
jgi:hypothetical protein